MTAKTNMSHRQLVYEANNLIDHMTTLPHLDPDILLTCTVALRIFINSSTPEESRDEFWAVIQSVTNLIK